MTFKRVILSSATAAAIVLTASFVNPSTLSIISQAQSATNVSVDVSFNTFYDDLAPDGSWVSYEDRYVWIPENVSEKWRPYTEGHWSYTRNHGWLWVSNERFGWATYHYGRWGYSRDIGWYWVPGKRWAPAWVAWSHGRDSIAWAPLPPQIDDDVTVSISYNDLPDYSWQAVPASAFLSINLSTQINRDPNYVRAVLQSSPPQTVIIQNNTVVNNVINVGFVEQQTNTTVVVHEEQPVTSPAAAGQTNGSTVAIFNPQVTAANGAKPATVKTADVVAQDRTAKGITPLAPATGQSVAPTKAPDANAAPAAKSDTTVVDPNAPKAATAPAKTPGGTTAPAAQSNAPAADPNAPKKDTVVPTKTPDATAAPTAKSDVPVVDPNAAKTDSSATAKSSGSVTTPAVKLPTPAVDPNTTKKDPVVPLKGTAGATDPAVKTPIVPVVPNAASTIQKAPLKPADVAPPVKGDAPTNDTKKAKIDNSTKTIEPQAAKPLASPLPPAVKPTPPPPPPAAKAPPPPVPKDIKPKPPAADGKNPKLACDPNAESCPPPK